MTPGGFLHAFQFLRPQWLLVLPLLWGLVFWLARRRGRDGGWANLIDAQLLPALRLDADGHASRQPWRWLALAWTLAALTLAGPSWQNNETPAYRTPAAWVFVLDLSPSMAASDLAPDRVTRARYALDDLLGAARDARVGLVAFSEEAFTVAPLTQDVVTVHSLLSPLVPEIMPSAGDRLAPALAQALTLIQQVGANDKRIIVLTDGFSDGAAAFAAAAMLKAQGARLAVIGLGTPGGAPLADARGQFQKDATGQTHSQTQFARMDIDQLRQLAATGGGRYIDLATLATLIAELKSSPQWTGDVISAPGVEVADRADAGIWLLPVLLLLTALLARRGWL